MTTLFTLPKVLALDTNVAGEAAAKLNFYAAGTSTRQDTYTDSALSVAHDNPVEADANGSFAPIFLQAAAYKVDLTDSADISLPGYPVDNVQGGETRRVATYAALKALADTAVTEGQVFYVESRATMGDDGEGYFRASLTTFGADDDGVIIHSTTGNRFFKRMEVDEYWPEWFGAIGDAKVWNASTGTWDIAASPTNDTVALQNCWDADPNKNLYLRKYYGVYPATSGSQISMTASIVVPDGAIVPVMEYVVAATSGAVTYNGTAYTNGQTFTGAFWHTGYTQTGDAWPRPYFKTALSQLFSSLAAATPVSITGPGGLVNYEAGAAFAIIAEYDGVAPDYLAYNVEVSVRVDAYSGTYGTSTIGGVVSGAVFHSSVERFHDVGSNIGLLAYNNWNMEYGHSSFDGGDNTRVGIMGINCNSSNFRHPFTHNFKLGCYVKFLSAHSASLTDTLTVSFNGSVEFTGTITEVVSTTEVLCENVTQTASTSLTYWTAKINAGGAIDIIDGYPVGGQGILMTNSDGCKVYSDFQHDAEVGFKYIIDGASGNIGLSLEGHFEGPANGVVIGRGPNSSAGELIGLDLNIGVYAGPAHSKANFGVYHGVHLDYVRNGIIRSGAFSMREYHSDSASTANWAASTAYSLDDIVIFDRRFYICSTAGTSAAGSVGPLGAGASIADNTAVWDFLHDGNSCITISENCAEISQEKIRVDHNHGNFAIADHQPRGNSTNGQFAMLEALASTEIISLSNQTADGSFTDVILTAPTGIRSASGDSSDWRVPKAVLAYITCTINVVGSSGRVSLGFDNDNLSASNDQGVVVHSGGVANSDVFTWQMWLPVTNFGQLRYQPLVTTSVSWDVDWSVRAIGFML